MRLLLAFLLTPAAFAHGSYSLSAALSAPFATSPTASPDGRQLAWLLNAQGARNVWLAAGPGWQGHQVTHFDTDDGQEVAQLAWSSDGKTLYFTRGGDFENGGENPNPDLALKTPAQELWAIQLATTTVVKVTEGSQPAPRSHSPDLYFCRKNQLFRLAGPASQPELVLTDHGKLRELTWSSDGAQLAFTSERRGHSFIGLYSPQQQTVQYLDASTADDSQPSWSPDSQLLAFVRVPSESRQFGPRRTAQPWSIRVFNCARHTTSEAFHAELGPGSAFHELATEQQISWGAKHQLIFPWERTGWLHLYALAAGGGAPVDLTPGDAEVDYAAISLDRATIYYSSNLTDLDRRHLWQRNLTATAAPVQLTKGEGIEWSPAPLASGELAALKAGVQERAGAVRIQPSGQAQPLAPSAIPTEYPARNLVPPEPVLLPAADGLVIHAQLFHPSGSPDSRHPALIFFHGGSRRQMLLGSHPMYYYSNAYAFNQYLASRGYLVLSVNYRSGIGYGLNFREALHYGPYGGSEYADVIGAGLYLRNRPDVDPARIGVWGGSYGGYLTAMALSRASNLFAAGVDFHGVHDWSTERDFTATGGDPAAQEAARTAARVAFESSPMATVAGWHSPVLLIHGDDDRNVGFEQTIILADALRRQGVPFEELIFPNEIHDFLRHRDWLAAYTAAAAFFDRYLNPGHIDRAVTSLNRQQVPAVP